MAGKEIAYTITRACLIDSERKEVGTVVMMEPGQGNYIVALNKAMKGEHKIEAPKAPKADKK